MPAISVKVIKGIPHFTVQSYLKRGRTFVFNATEEDSDKPVVVKITHVRDIEHAKTLAWTLGWTIKDPA